MCLSFYICRTVKLPAIEKAVKKNKKSTAAVIKSEPLDESPIIIDDYGDQDVKPLIVSAASKIKSDSKQPCVEMKPLQLRPVPKQIKPQTVRRGRSFKHHEISRQNVTGKIVDKADYNELKAAEGLVGLGGEQPKTGYIHNLRKRDEKPGEMEKKGSNKEQVENKLQEGKSVEVGVNETEAETKNKEQPIITDPLENVGSNKEQVEKKLQEGKSVEVVVNETEAETKNKEQLIITDPVENVGSIKKQVENMLQEGTSVEDSESRISTLKGILLILEKKDETVSEKDSDVTCKKEGTNISVQENVIDKTDKTDDTVYKLHVQVESVNEVENGVEIDHVATEMVENVIRKLDDEAKDDKLDVDNVSLDYKVGGEPEKLNEVHSVAIAQKESYLPHPSGPGAVAGPGYVKSNNNTCSEMSKKVHVSFSNYIDVSSAETKTVVTCSQMDDNVSDASEEKLVIDDSAMCGTAKGVSVEGDSSNESVICRGGEVPLEDQEWTQSILPCSQMPRVDPYAKFKDRGEEQDSSNR